MPTQPPTTNPQMRLFTALWPSQAAVDALRSDLDAAGADWPPEGWRATAPSRWHLTLCFHGDADPGMLARQLDQCAAGCVAPACGWPAPGSYRGLPSPACSAPNPPMTPRSGAGRRGRRKPRRLPAARDGGQSAARARLADHHRAGAPPSRPVVAAGRGPPGVQRAGPRPAPLPRPAQGAAAHGRARPVRVRRRLVTFRIGCGCGPWRPAPSHPAEAGPHGTRDLIKEHLVVALNAAQKKTILTDYGVHDADTGSPRLRSHC